MSELRNSVTWLKDFQSQIVSQLKLSGCKPEQMDHLLRLNDKLMQAEKEGGPGEIFAASEAFNLEAQRLAGGRPSAKLSTILSHHLDTCEELARVNVPELAGAGGSSYAPGGYFSALGSASNQADSVATPYSNATDAAEIANAIKDTKALPGLANLDKATAPLTTLQDSVADSVTEALKHVGFESQRVDLFMKEMADVPLAGAVTVATSAYGTAKSGVDLYASAKSARQHQADLESIPELQSVVGQDDLDALTAGSSFLKRIAQAQAALHATEGVLQASSAGVTVAGAVGGVTAPAGAIAGQSLNVASKVTGKVNELVKSRAHHYMGLACSETAQVIASKRSNLIATLDNKLDKLRTAASLYEKERLVYCQRKVDSLLLDVIASEEMFVHTATKTERPSTPEERRAKLEGRLDPDLLRPGSKRLYKGTTAQAPDLEAMQRIAKLRLTDEMLSGSGNAVSSRVYQSIMRSPGAEEARKALAKPIARAFVDRLKGIDDPIVAKYLRSTPKNEWTEQRISELCAAEPQAKAAYERVAAPLINKQLKTDAAYQRTQIAAELFAAAKAQRLATAEE